MRGEVSMNSGQTSNPNGGVCNRRGVEELSSGFHQGSVGENSLPGYGPVIMVKRPVRSRMQGVVGFLLPTSIGYPNALSLS